MLSAFQDFLSWKSELHNWLVSAVHEVGSPIWIGKEIFQNLFAAFIGAIFSLILIAPLTARYVARQNRRKWAGARSIAIKEFGFNLLALLVSLNRISRMGSDGFKRPAPLKDILLKTAADYEALEQTYTKWGEVWTPEQHAEISRVLELFNLLGRSVIGSIASAILSKKMSKEEAVVLFGKIGRHRWFHRPDFLEISKSLMIVSDLPITEQSVAEVDAGLSSPTLYSSLVLYSSEIEAGTIEALMESSLRQITPLPSDFLDKFFDVRPKDDWLTVDQVEQLIREGKAVRTGKDTIEVLH